MAGTYQELHLSEEVSATSETCQSFVPASGKDVFIHFFAGESEAGDDTSVRLVWNFEGSPEECVWTIDGSATMPFKYKIDSTDVDGIKKLGLCLTNNTNAAHFMSGHVDIWVKDPPS
ncbi:MAG: hypothetical protein GTO54_02685 [Nitrososphaeria archaeon]|nr:hypothetical protein [Nitrososphaeria archaeon]